MNIQISYSTYLSFCWWSWCLSIFRWTRLTSCWCSVQLKRFLVEFEDLRVVGRGDDTGESLKYTCFSAWGVLPSTRCCCCFVELWRSLLCLEADFSCQRLKILVRSWGDEAWHGVLGEDWPLVGGSSGEVATFSGDTVRRSFNDFVPASGTLIEDPTVLYNDFSKVDRSYNLNNHDGQYHHHTIKQIQFIRKSICCVCWLCISFACVNNVI